MSSGSAAGKSILVVEDNDVEREGMAAVLRQKGYQVATAEDGEQALTYLRQQKADLILLSMFLPVCNGWEFLRDRKGEWQPTPVIIIMGSRDAASPELAASFGAQDAIGKPVNTAELFRKVAQHCG